MKTHRNVPSLPGNKTLDIYVPYSLETNSSVLFFSGNILIAVHSVPQNPWEAFID